MQFEESEQASEPNTDMAGILRLWGWELKHEYDKYDNTSNGKKRQHARTDGYFPAPHIGGPGETLFD